MKDQETVQKFIELRARGSSFVRIAAEFGVAKSTLTEWSRKFRFEIHNRRALELDDLQDRVLGTVQSRVAALADKLSNVENELRRRGLADVSTSQLYSLAASLRRQIERATGPVRLVTPTKAIPQDEYVDEIQEWNPQVPNYHDEDEPGAQAVRLIDAPHFTPHRYDPPCFPHTDFGPILDRFFANAPVLPWSGGPAMLDVGLEARFFENSQFG